MEEIRRLERCSRSINSTFLALIPNFDSPNSFNDFKPIPLCNGLYKIIVNRIKPFLSSTITQELFGFVKGRLIHEAIVCAQEEIHSIKSQKRLVSIIKIDLVFRLLYSFQ
jgi:hypothetical protein